MTAFWKNCKIKVRKERMINMSAELLIFLISFIF